MRLNNLAYLLVFSFPAVLCGQKDAKYIYEGNEFYHSGKLPQASTAYSKALKENPSNRKAQFNLGNALYKNGLLIKTGKMGVPDPNMTPDSAANILFDEAAENFAVVANSVSDKDTLHRAWHNIGNSYLQKKDYRQAVEAYKKSLKHDPGDEETRYNLAYALKHLPKEEKKGGGGQSQQQQQQQQQQEKKQQPQQQQSQMSKEQAEQLLKALMDNEKKLQDKRKQKQEDASRGNTDKDW
jgi:Ca-activated chloride channel homolog